MMKVGQREEKKSPSIEHAFRIFPCYRISMHQISWRRLCPCKILPSVQFHGPQARKRYLQYPLLSDSPCKYFRTLTSRTWCCCNTTDICGAYQTWRISAFDRGYRLSTLVPKANPVYQSKMWRETQHGNTVRIRQGCRSIIRLIKVIPPRW